MNDSFEPRLAQLLRQERARPDPDASARTRVFARVQATLGTPAPSGAPPNAHPVAGHGLSLPATVLSIVAVGTAATLLALRSSPTAIPPVQSARRGAAIALESGSVSAPPVSAAPQVVTDPARARPATAAPPSSAPGDLATEQALLDRARGGLLHGEPAEALASIGAHARRFPHGALSEERDALRVEALVAAQRYDEARSAAAKFHAAYPDSVLSAAVEGALGEIP